ncbi:exopolysaccharide biosynthesis protein [Cohnella sp. CIP 111063]|uniref:phosphodiester glycosidase family protein n=1 Tax=unclassified Cohnella TaxID=2636738 RepID=UPI000B9C92C2|nr:MULTISPECIES: phosphodiester glycosidase family protein [unclassified Cohnella]OXS53573.1 exopolysaccharide biosynthesis protein [Cohnella sp. CIP 111063]PRX61603.1 exopolysaccharide biosynthesis protein [Cohnella sp. SGD-V74]
MQPLPPRSSKASSLSASGNGVKTAAPSGARKTVRRKRSLLWSLYKFVFVTGCLSVVLFAAWFYLTPSGNTYRYMLADSLITTQHREWAKYIIGEKALRERVARYAQQFEEMGEERDTHTIPAAEGEQAPEGQVPEELISVKEVDGEGFHGYLLTVRDPKKVRLVVPGKTGRGEKVSSMVKRTGALAGVNAGGFADPNWRGNGFKPIGLVISQGKIYYNGLGSAKSVQIVGIDKDGKMLAGKYSIDELMKLGISEAVSFSPRIIVNGKGLIPNRSQGWGVAPRTVMGQREDGAILFLLIDGRQPGYSIGATLYDAQEILLEHGAVIAANLDGGSSTVLVNESGEIVNKPSSSSGERYLPTAFLVFEHPETVDVPNIWAGLKPSEIDAGKW